MKIRDLLEKRSATVTEMRGITEKPEGKAGDLSETQSKRFDELKSELSGLEARIERQQLIDDAERRVAAPAIVNGNGRDGRFEERARDFSLIKAINAQLGDPVDAGFEREMSAEVRSRNPGRNWRGNIIVPDEYFTIEKRVLTVQESPADAASLFPAQHRPDLFIDLLRSMLFTGRLGATVLDGLVGTQDIPRQIDSATAQWVGEEGALTASDPDFDDVQLSPRTVGAITSYSRRTLINAVPSIENIVRNDLAAVVARAIDSAAIFGTGTNQPTGVANVSGITAGTLATPSWDEVLQVIAAIEADDAAVGSMGWLMRPEAVANLRATTKVSSDAGAGFLMDSPNAMAGFPVVTSTALPRISTAADNVFFASWSQLLIGRWSGTDILVNPYEAAAYSRGRVSIRAMQDVDVAVRHAEAFVHVDDLPQ